MTMPGFTAGLSIYDTQQRNRTALSGLLLRDSSSRVVPARGTVCVVLTSDQWWQVFGEATQYGGVVCI
jgi:hypothetical protein